jgi:hypothetical protein
MTSRGRTPARASELPSDPTAIMSDDPITGEPQRIFAPVSRTRETSRKRPREEDTYRYDPEDTEPRLPPTIGTPTRDRTPVGYSRPPSRASSEAPGINHGDEASTPRATTENMDHNMDATPTLAPAIQLGNPTLNETILKALNHMNLHIHEMSTEIKQLKNQNKQLEKGNLRLEGLIQQLLRNAKVNPSITIPQISTKTPQAIQPTPAGTNKPKEQPQKTQPQTTTTPQNNTKATAWNEVVKRGRNTNTTGPAKKVERTIIIHRKSEDKNEELDTMAMRNNINMHLITAKAPTCLQISGIHWNRRGNLTLTTKDGFTEEQLTPFQAMIESQVKRFDQEVTDITKQESWTKMIIHGIDTQFFPDTDEGMQNLRTEIETYNEDLKLTNNPRYLTHPDRRVGKAHSSCVIAVKSKDTARRFLKVGITVFGKTRKTAEYFTARPTDQCSKCQQFGHHWQRCNNPPKCGICADPFHETRTHVCTQCRSKTGCTHMQAKCANCNGPHRASYQECETLLAIRNPQVAMETDNV